MSFAIQPNATNEGVRPLAYASMRDSAVVVDLKAQEPTLPAHLCLNPACYSCSPLPVLQLTLFRAIDQYNAIFCGFLLLLHCLSLVAQGLGKSLSLLRSAPGPPYFGQTKQIALPAAVAFSCLYNGISNIGLAQVICASAFHIHSCPA